jgi:hypothetical protein
MTGKESPLSPLLSLPHVTKSSKHNEHRSFPDMHQSVQMKREMNSKMKQLTKDDVGKSVNTDGGTANR